MANGDAPLSPQQVDALQTSGALDQGTADTIRQRFTPITPDVQIPPELQVSQAETLLTSADISPAPQEVVTPTPVQDIEEEAVQKIKQRKIEKSPGQLQFDAKKRELIESANLGRRVPISDVSDVEVLDALDAESKQRFDESAAAKNVLEKRIGDRMALLARAGADDISLTPDEELDPIIQKRQQEAQALTQKADDLAPATQDDVDQAPQPTKEDIRNAAEPIKQANARAIAQAEENASNQRAQKEKVAAATAEVEEDEKSESFTSLGNLFKTGTAGDKIGAALVIMAGALSQGLTGRAQNPGLQALNTIFKQEADRLKLQGDDRDKARQAYWKEVEIRSKLGATKISNAKKLADIDKITSEAKTQQESAKQKRINERITAKGEGFTREQVARLPKELRERMIFFSDGLARPALSAGSAKKLRQETLPEAQGALRGLSQMRKLKDKFLLGGDFALDARAEAKVLQQTLVGGLRIELFGPGVLTETEQAIARSIIGNPTKIFSLDSLEMTKIDVLEKKLKFSITNRLRAEGIQLPPSQNEIRIKQVMEAQPGTSRAQAMTGLITEGKWVEEGGF